MLQTNEEFKIGCFQSTMLGKRCANATVKVRARAVRVHLQEKRCTQEANARERNQLRNLRKLKFAVTSAFAGDKPVVLPVFQAFHDCSFDPRARSFVKEGMVRGIKMCNMNEKRYKVTAARIGKALALFSLNRFVDFDETVVAMWEAIRHDAVIKLQREWMVAIADPSRDVCLRRLLREWNEMAEIHKKE